MKNITKPAILIVLNLMLLQSLFGQEQKDITEYIKQKFLRYIEVVPREEIFLHSDREEYVSGEDLWFNVYLIDRQNCKPSLNSKIVYIELLNTENRPVVQKRILLDKGFGPGQIILPDTLSSGTYTIRAYTSWMKNFFPGNCFVKDISVFNTLSSKPFKQKLSHGTIINNGRGNPDTDKVKGKGVSFSVNNSKSDILELYVNADNKFRSENNNILYLFIQTHGNINYARAEKVTDELSTITISKALLDEGINQITIFDSKAEPVLERYIYTPVKENNILTLNSVDSFSLRDKITLEIMSGNVPFEAIKSSNLSISVSPKLNNPDIVNIDDYMVFGTEYGMIPWNIVKGRRINEFPAEVMDSILLNVRSNWIDWETVLSIDLPGNKYQTEDEDHFLMGKLVSSDQQTVLTNEFLLLCTPGKEAVFQYARTDNKGNFSFNIHIDEEQKDLVFIPNDITKNCKIIFESSFSDQYTIQEVSIDTTKRLLSSYFSKLGVNYQVRKIFGVSTLGTPLNPVLKPVKPLRFYGKPDIELIMADYISLPVMEEVFFELLPHVSLKKKYVNYEISISDRIDNNPYFTSPSLMLDGVIVKDASLIADLDPEIVEKIDVIKEKYLVGEYYFYGIVNVITKAGNFSCVPLPDYMIRLPYRVIDPVYSFVSPQYSSDEMKKSRIPDYRNTLYWNPSLRPDIDGKTKIEFWSSDNKSEYVIRIEGLTSDGKLMSLRKVIRVE